MRSRGSSSSVLQSIWLIPFFFEEQVGQMTAVMESRKEKSSRSSNVFNALGSRSGSGGIGSAINSLIGSGSQRSYSSDLDEVLKATSGLKKKGRVLSANNITSDKEFAKQEISIAKPNVHYQGFIHSRQAQTVAYMDSVILLNKAIGGETEFRNKEWLKLKVPVQHFKKFYDKLRRIGDVYDYSQWAVNLSNQISENKLRLKLAKQTRAKLTQLIAKARKESEKLELLRKLQLVSQEIQNYQNQKITLENLTLFAKIELKVIPLGVVNYKPIEVPNSLRWVSNLSPMHIETVGVRFDVPEVAPQGFIKIDHRRQKIWVAAEGSQYWIQRRVNNPKGDIEFWNEILKKQLLPLYNNVKNISKGETKIFRMETRDYIPAVYWVMMNLDNEDILIHQAYFPNVKVEEEYSEELIKILGGAK